MIFFKNLKYKLIICQNRSYILKVGPILVKHYGVCVCVGGGGGGGLREFHHGIYIMYYHFLKY